MNWSEIQGDWARMQALLLTHWPQLHAQDLAGVDGKRDGLARVLQVRYALTARQAEDAICRFEKDVRWPGTVK